MQKFFSILLVLALFSAGIPVHAQTATPFSVGERVQTTAKVNVRATPTTNGKPLGSQLSGAQGTIVAGPTTAKGSTWYQVNFDSGVDGWSVQDYLVPVGTTPTPTPTGTPAPTLSLTTSAATITSGSSATLTWSSTNATSCTASGAWTGTLAVSGSQVVSPTANATYTLTCVGAGGSVTQSVSIAVSSVSPTPTPTTSTVTGASIATSSNGTGYYVDFSAGSDSNPGTQAAPWKHAPGDPNATGGPATVALKPGNTVFFKGGVHYYGQITIPASGATSSPITYDGGSWGGTAIIDGSQYLSNFVPCASQADCAGNPNWANIYKTPLTPPSFLTKEPEIRLNIMQNDQVIIPAQTPQSSSRYYQSTDTYYSVPATQVTATTLTDTRLAALGGPALVGSYLYIWEQGNDIFFQKITGYSGSTITFVAGNPPYIDRDTKYAIANAPTGGVFTQAGEYYYDLAGKTLYVWPLSGNPNNTVTYSAHSVGIDTGVQSHVAIKGFKIMKQTGESYGGGAGIAKNRSGHTSDIDIENNELTLMQSDGYAAISIQDVDSVTVAGNTVHDILGNMRGLQFSGSNILVRGNTLRNIARTGIFFGGVKSGRITGNTMSDSNSTHGNGISTYLQDDQIMVDHNTVVDANIAFTMEESSNITVTENVFDGAGNTTAVFADWGGMTGANKITHNTIIGSSNHSALQVVTKTGATFDIEYNILDGGPYGSNMTTANNVYVGLGWGQSSAYGWVLGPGESTATLAQVFVHPGTRDYTTTTLYAAYGATTPINNVASAYAAGDLWASLWSAVQSMFTQLVHFFTHFGGA